MSTASPPDHAVMPRLGHWAAGLALLAFGLHLFAITSRIPTLTAVGLVVAILLTVAVFVLSLKTYVRAKGMPFPAVRTFFLLLTVAAPVAGILMLKELLTVLGAGSVGS